MTTSETSYSPQYSMLPRLNCPQHSPGDHSTTPLDLTISPTSTHPSPRRHSPRDQASPPMAQPTPPPSSRPPYQCVGMRTMAHPQDLSNPSNHPRTSTTQLLLQVALLIDSNGFVKSFATAYVPVSLTLHLVVGAMVVVPDPAMH